MFFYCTYALVGHYLLGQSIESFSDYTKAISTSFAMMNANVEVSSFEPAIDSENTRIVVYMYPCRGFNPGLAGQNAEPVR